MRVSALYGVSYATDRRVMSETRRERHKYEMRLWERRGGNAVDVHDLAPATFDAFRLSATAGGRAPKTIESVIDTILTVLRSAHVGGFGVEVPARGQRLRVVIPTPDVQPIEHLSRAYEFAEYGPIRSKRDGRYWRAFFAVAYFTALRRGD